MDDQQFDRLARLLDATLSRRLALGLSVVGIGSVPLATVADAKKRKKQKQRKKKKAKCKRGRVRCRKRCVKSATDMNNCGKCGNRCQSEHACVNGNCVCQRTICRLSVFETVDSPGDLALDADGNIVTAMYFDDKLANFSPAGQLLREIGEFGNDPGEFDRPASVAVAASGTLYVADYGNARIQKIARVGDIEVWNPGGSPQGIAVSSLGAIYATFGSQIHRLTESGQVSYSWGPGGDDASEFDWPGDIAVDSSGDVYVVDEDANMVYRFTDGGAGSIQQHWAIGGPGTDPGEFNLPSSVAVNAGRVFVADEDNFRVQVLDAKDGSFVFERRIEDDGFAQFVVGVAAAADGRVYVATFDGVATFELGIT